MSRSKNSKKRWDKPNKPFKKVKERKYKSEVRAAFKKDKELPLHKRTAQWDWL